MKKILLSVAGFDPCSGAGVLLDLCVFRELGFYGMAVLTSVTSQNTRLVKDIHCLPPEFLYKQFATLQEDVPFSGVKIGMVGCRNNVSIIAKILAKCRKYPRVVDPVFRSSSGAWLIENDAIPSFIAAIKSKASLLTPNRAEAKLMARIRVESLEEMKEAAQRIFHFTQVPCLIKGGFLKNKVADVLYDGIEFQVYENEKIKKKVHGTGCFLSSAILCFLAKGKPLEKACSDAISLTHRAIKKAIRLGQGNSIFTFPFQLL